jgi:hypothetical protein
MTPAVEHEIEGLVRQILPLLRVHHRNTQWGALAELMAIWLNDHAAVEPKLLEPLLRVHVNAVRKLVEAEYANRHDP